MLSIKNSNDRVLTILTTWMHLHVKKKKEPAPSLTFTITSHSVNVASKRRRNMLSEKNDIKKESYSQE